MQGDRTTIAHFFYVKKFSLGLLIVHHPVMYTGIANSYVGTLLEMICFYPQLTIVEVGEILIL